CAPPAVRSRVAVLCPMLVLPGRYFLGVGNGICRAGQTSGLGRTSFALGTGKPVPSGSRLPINIGTDLPELGVIPKKRAAGVSALFGQPAKPLPSYSAWYLAGELARVRRRVGGRQTRRSRKWPISID